MNIIHFLNLTQLKGFTIIQFKFFSGKPFTFGGGAAVKPAEEKPAENEDKEDEDDEPPKPDFKPVTEEGSIYEQK